MFKSRKYLSVIISLLFCFCLVNQDVKAANSDTRVGDIIDGSQLTTESETQGFVQQILRGTYLSDGSSNLSDCGNGLVYVSGFTNCNRVSSTVNLGLYLQRLENGSWQYVTDQTYSKSDAFYVSGGYYITVKKGYYYRVSGVHSASSGSITESNSSVTNGIWIG